MGKKWSEQEKATLEKLYRGGMPVPRIAVTMDGMFNRKFTRPGVQGQIDRMGLNKQEGAADYLALQVKELREEIDRLKAVEEENEILRTAIKSLLRQQHAALIEYGNEPIRFGVLGDTQLGSYFTDYDFLELAYDIYQQENIKYVFHTGDMVDGTKVYKGQEYELEVNGEAAQKHCVVDRYPARDGIKTFFIGGNHDYSFFKVSGADIGEDISMLRDDLVYLGFDDALVKLYDAKGHELFVELTHPTKGTAYALSYHIQKFIEALPGGLKPHILLYGHTHKAEHIPGYRNVQAIQTGCMQRQTKFMKGGNIAAMVAFCIVQVVMDERGIIRCKTEFFPAYETQKEVKEVHWEEMSGLLAGVLEGE